jgi:hypothetical protein
LFIAPRDDGSMSEQSHLQIWIRLAAACLVALIGTGFGKIARPAPYDPVLMGEPPGPCDPDLRGPDVAAGTDVYGHPVAPADAGTGSATVILNSDRIVPEVRVDLPNVRRVLVDANVNGLSATVNRQNRCARSR